LADEGICAGPCNERYRRARREYQQALDAYNPLDSSQSRPEPPDIRPTEGWPWCSDCRQAIREQLADLDLLAALRTVTADGYPADAGGQRVSGSREHTSPSPAADDADDTTRMLAGWEDAYRDLNGWPSGTRKGELAHERTETIAWLLERLDGILASPFAADFGAEVMRWHAELKAKTKAGVRNLRKPLRCPRCKLLLLRWTEGEKTVRCYNPDCGAVIGYDEYEATVEQAAKAIEKGGLTRESAGMDNRQLAV
jgi:hypothetical protein